MKTAVLVIGGGATGAGILWDLTLRGIDALLVEQRELAYGTTGRCHGLLHSGGRYVVRDRSVARECYRENQILRRVAAAAVEETGGFFVHLEGDAPVYAERWAEAATSAGIPFREIDLSEAHRLEPLLSRNVRRVFLVPDASIDPFDLVMINAQGAIRRGAKVLTGVRVEKLLVEGRRVRGAVLKDIETGEIYSVNAEVVVNAAGPWAGQVAATAGSHLQLAYGKGTLLVYSQRLCDHVINRLRPPGDGDILVPAKTVSLLGTTDLPALTPDNPEPTGDEIKALLDRGEELIPGLAGRRVLRSFAGVRPIYDPGEGAGRGASRGFAVVDHEEADGIHGFCSVVGGKLTTYRLMAEQAADLVAAKLGVSERCRTKDTCLPALTTLAPVPPDSIEGKSAPLVCECELLDKETFLQAVRRLARLTPEALLRGARLAHGPCQGTTCIYRGALLLYREKLLSYAGCREFMRRAFRARQRRGEALQGDQARQLELARGIYLQNLQLGGGDDEL
jgi:glycerol-3-phosphate dehydrogenase